MNTTNQLAGEYSAINHRKGELLESQRLFAHEFQNSAGGSGNQYDDKLFHLTCEGLGVVREFKQTQIFDTSNYRKHMSRGSKFPRFDVANDNLIIVNLNGSDQRDQLIKHQLDMVKSN